MIDLHTHSIFSDGELIPSELVQRARTKGYRAIAITDHGDESNIDFIIPRVVHICSKLTKVYGMPILGGIEITHVPPEMIDSLVGQARRLGAQIILVHGETLVEPVPVGTNRAAIEAGVHILAHPGLITEEEVALAAQRGVFLEISTRKGHCLANGHVVRLAKLYGASLILNTDAHAPEDLITCEEAVKIAQGAGLSTEEVLGLLKKGEELAEKLMAGEKAP
ncbi:MAG: histidinol phosphate phosphatase domain-containing protein [Syntrophales bacterium]|nr:histidinol phosphate phosphatase domain-containing protein [Syntrophales bacterium]